MIPRPRRTRLRTTAVVALAIAALAGCSDDDPGTIPPVPTSTAPVQGDPTAIPTAPGFEDFPESSDGPGTQDGSSTSGVQLIDDGTTPRRVLAYTAEEGYAETTTMEVATTSTVDDASTELPDLRLTLDNRVTRTAGTEVTVLQQITGAATPGLSGSARTQADEALAPLLGSGFTFQIARSGVELDLAVNPPSGLSEDVSTLLTPTIIRLTTLTVPFPSEPIGPGASWQVETSLDLRDLAVRQVTTYTLASLDGDAYEIDVKVAQEFTGAIGGVDIDDGAGSGSGSMRGSLASLAPLSATIGSTVTLEGTTGAEADDVEVRTDNDTQVTTVPRP